MCVNCSTKLSYLNFRDEWNVLFGNCFLNKFSFLKSREFIAKWFRKVGKFYMAGLTKLKLTSPDELFGSKKNLPMRKLFLYVNFCPSGIKLWLLEEIFVKVVKNYSMCAWERFQWKSILSKPLYFSILCRSIRKKFIFRRMFFGNVVEIAFYVCSRTISEKQFFFGEK